MDQTFSLQTLTKLVVIDFGHKSKVWLVSSGNKKYALKELSKASLTDVDVHHLFQERAALQSLNHSNIIELITTFKDEESVYLLLSLAKGAPLSHIQKQQRKFPLEQVQSIIHQVNLYIVCDYNWLYSFSGLYLQRSQTF